MKTLSIAAIAMMTLHVVKAQERGGISAFGGYSASYEIFDPVRHGWNVSVAGNVMKHLAIVGEFSGHSRKTSYGDYSDYTFLCGPQYVHRIGGISLFAHALFGLYHLKKNSAGFFGGYRQTKINMFALASGGGMDIHINRRLSARIFQVDLVGSSDRHRGYGRVSAGVVINLTHRKD